ncbi:hypothetical protein BH11BAC3_BH11BAC3_21010 [soil metagenome]
MQISNNQLKALIIAGIIIYILTVSITLITGQAIIYVAALNAASSLSLLLYWIRKQLLITRHYYDFAELFVVGFEVLFSALTVYAIFFSSAGKWLLVAQYIIVGIHFAVLVFFLIFSLTFKIKRLF